MQALRYVASVLDAGFPLVAFLQLSRVYGQTLSQVADAETRLFHLYVHEPLMRDGVPGLQMAEEMEHLARDLLPLASPIMDYIHQRYLQHFVEQDVIGHMEMDLEDDAELGRVKVAVAFADLAGYTRFTEEEGEEEALSYVERFIEAVQDTIPEDARVVKTIGDEVMVVGYDVAALVDWAVGFQTLWTDRPTARIGIHYGSTLYRDGDYFGRDINLASRVVARSRGGEVLATDTRDGRDRRAGPPRVREPRRGEAEGLRRAAQPLPGLPTGGMNALEAARASGLVVAGEPLLVLLSGGADSVCLLDVAIELEAGVAALHVNYGLREGADDDERFCRELCDRLGVPLTVERADGPPDGQRAGLGARSCATATAERVAEGDYATGHTLSDQAETVVYRLAASPGRRALLGMEPRRGRLVRPLLEVTREDTREWCRSRGLEWREDPTQRGHLLRARACEARGDAAPARAEPRRRAQHRRDGAPPSRGAGADRRGGGRRARAARPGAGAGRAAARAGGARAARALTPGRA